MDQGRAQGGLATEDVAEGQQEWPTEDMVEVQEK
jgi:hypothetical protein